MAVALFDHLWQSLAYCALTGLLAWIVRDCFARLRLWMWRIAALKFLVPFALAYAVGAWLGFPVSHSADPPPPLLVAWLAAWTPVFRPAHTFELTGLAPLLVALTAAASCVLAIARRQREERIRSADEAFRVERDVDDVLPRPGFFESALLTAFALLAISIPLLTGAIADRQWQRDLLISNLRALRTARVVTTSAAPGMGTRFRVRADANGVLIRNATVRELVGLAYGVNTYFVRGNHFYKEGEQDWLLGPRYDIRIVAPVREPGRFDTYALHQAVTRMLAERFGLEIYIKEQCQPPCGRYGVAMPEATL